MKKLDFILTSDDVGRGKVEEFNRFISLLEEHKIICTFFAVPKPRDNLPLKENKEWTYALKKAIDKGHDVQLHGYAHERFECGFPPNFILSLYKEKERKNVIEYMIKNKKEIEKNLEFNVLKDKLEESKEIFENIFGYSPICFRSPLLAKHKNLYKAIKKIGINFTSNEIINPNGWNYIINEEFEDGKCKIPLLTKMQNGIRDLPISCEYSWFLEDKNFDRAFDLMKYDAEKISDIKNAFMLPLSHFYAVVNSEGEKLYRKFFSYAKDNFDFRSHTINKYLKSKF
ncbi:MAG: DUF2334 domain-containing protein [Candidatus Pacearchaeota archaeon]|nr:DUF2334 domain-containing protein [Candidatus Pacearchaeota archaeon]